MRYFRTSSTRTRLLKPWKRSADFFYVGDSFLGTRVSALRQWQNADGGWGYFPGKQSWLEPTLYAALALHGDPSSDRAWELVSTWQGEDGSWRPSAGVEISNSATALCVTTAAARGEFGWPLRKAVAWLVGTAGVESSLRNRVLTDLHLMNPERRLDGRGWPWKPGTSSWVEPSAHALVALKKAAPQMGISGIQARIRSGEEQLFSVQCRDGGWNYGSPMARGVDLPSYPETTALALVGLQGNSRIAPALDLASRLLRDTASPLARAWLAIALRVNEAAVQPPANGAASSDVLITALEALSAPEGNHQLLKTGAWA